ncbi:protein DETOXIFICATION 9-like [Nicotiana tabacum]|uniref:Protein DETOXIFICATION n=1 Tax=Nicotiana tabacum TaxID=4097 RepID=A0A1S3Y1P7_TOBAC|nr:PREDICTED: protein DETOXIFICATION 9-like [Nicotiana tabacum]
MEEALLPLNDVIISKRVVFKEEVKEVSRLAIPMIVGTMCQYLLRYAPMVMLGHLSELSLSSASIATSYCTVTGFAILFGMASGLETLCGQAYGARQYQKVGTITYAALIFLLFFCLPISLLWIYTENLLLWIGQDPSISVEAGKYSIWLIPTLFPYAILQSLFCYFQAQSLILPILWSSIVSLCFNIPLSWAFIFKFNFGTIGAAIAIGLSYWLNVILLVIYLKYSSTCKKTRPFFSKDVFHVMPEFFQFAFPSAGMVGLRWWAVEIITLLGGLLPNPQLETSVLSICLTTSSIHFNLPFSFGAAASIRISNELGAGNPKAARVSIYAVFTLAAAEFLLASGILFSLRNVWGYAFTHDQEVVDLITEITPLLCLSIIVYSTVTVLSGVARGSGWQKLGAYVNLGSYYLVGIPASLLMGFVWNWKAKGLWCGLLMGSTVQAILLCIITGLTDWEKLAKEARERLFDRKICGNK